MFTQVHVFLFLKRGMNTDSLELQGKQHPETVKSEIDGISWKRSLIFCFFHIPSSVLTIIQELLCRDYINSFKTYVLSSILYWKINTDIYNYEVI